MKEDGEGGGIRGEDDEFGGSAVEGFGCWMVLVGLLDLDDEIGIGIGGKRTLVSTLLQLTVMRSLLDEVEEGLGEGFVGERPRYYH